MKIPNIEEEKWKEMLKILDGIKQALSGIWKDIGAIRNILEKKPGISEEDFKVMIKNAVHKFGFAKYDGQSDYLKGRFGYEVKTKKGKSYIIFGHYWDPNRGPNFPSEQVEKYFDEAEKTIFLM